MRIFLALVAVAGGAAGQSCIPPVVDGLFIVDSTPSVTAAEHKQFLDFVRRFTSRMSIGLDGSRVGLLQFTPMARPEFYPNIYLDQTRLDSAVAGVPYAPCLNVEACYGATTENASVAYVTELGMSAATGNRPPIRDAIVILTTGVYRPLILPSRRPFAEPVSPRHVFTIQIGSGGSVTDYTLPFATSMTRLGAANYQLLSQLLDPLCEAMVRAVTGSMTVFGGPPSRPVFIDGPMRFHELPTTPPTSTTTTPGPIVVASGSRIGRVPTQEAPGPLALTTRAAASDGSGNFVGFPGASAGTGALSGVAVSGGSGSSAAVGTAGVASASFTSSPCFAPILFLILIFLLFFLLLAAVLVWQRRKIRKLEQRVEELSRWGNQRDLQTAKSMQATDGPGTAFGRREKRVGVGIGVGVQSRNGSLGDSLDQEDILITSLGHDDRERLIKAQKEQQLRAASHDNEAAGTEHGVTFEATPSPPLDPSPHGRLVSSRGELISLAPSPPRRSVRVVSPQARTPPQEVHQSQGDRLSTPWPRNPPPREADTPAPLATPQLRMEGGHQHTSHSLRTSTPVLPRANLHSATNRQPSPPRDQVDLSSAHDSRLSKHLTGSVISHPLSVTSRSPSPLSATTRANSKDDESPQAKPEASARTITPPLPTAPEPQRGELGGTAGVKDRKAGRPPSDSQPSHEPPLGQKEETGDMPADETHPEGEDKEDRIELHNFRPTEVSVHDVGEKGVGKEKKEKIESSLDKGNEKAGDLDDDTSSNDNGDLSAANDADELSADDEHLPQRYLDDADEEDAISTTSIGAMTENVLAYRTVSRSGLGSQLDEQPLGSENPKKKQVRGLPNVETVDDLAQVAKPKQSRGVVQIQERQRQINKDYEKEKSQNLKASPKAKTRKRAHIKDAESPQTQVVEVTRQREAGSDGVGDSASQVYDRAEKNQYALDNMSRLTRSNPLGFATVAAQPEDEISDGAVHFNDGTSTPVFYKDLDEENAKHNPYSANHIPFNHPATRLPYVDVCFLVDNSGSIGNVNFGNVRAFIEKASDDIAVGPQKSRIGLVTFNTEPVLYLGFEKYFSNPTVKRAIQRLPYSGGGTLLGKAIDFIVHLLNEERRKRKKKYPEEPHRLQILTVISDGFTEDSVEPAAAVLHGSCKATVAAVGVRDRNTDKLETLTRDPDAIFSLDDAAAFSNWLFKQQFRWEEEFDPKDRATTAALGLKGAKETGETAI